MTEEFPSAPNWQQIITLVMRLTTFALTLAVIGAFFLPWMKLDGINEASSGLKLTSMTVSSMFDYFYSVSPVQTWVVIGCPALMMLFAIRVAMKYAQCRTALFSTNAVLASSIALIFGTPNIVAGDGPGPYLSLSLIVALSIALLVHQILIKLRARLSRAGKFPSIDRAIAVIAGSPYEGWRSRLDQLRREYGINIRRRY